ncbi:hypothetical protein [Flavobacterium gilvum]|uniref:Uncharacterized protein n=1 Tax=Flavobacterium gilvum TaxID=1492737 RepID=A0AAC9I6Y6_9FLAO|nr:hypothetical protein [Flavobacterium gilvum]AOW10807.1 hypothetical protein EM308_15650 [Flavobacterium gilvum]KFC59962.1 hypothetical protein FEM08_12660 [Flavobacterium gilvum]
MKKILFAIGSIVAMIIVSSCSADSLDDVKNENAINKSQITSDTLRVAPAQLMDDGVDDKDKAKT